MFNIFTNKNNKQMSQEVENTEVKEVEVKEVVESNGTVTGDYESGITNFRVLANKHDKTVKEIANYLRNKKK